MFVRNFSHREKERERDREKVSEREGEGERERDRQTERERQRERKIIFSMLEQRLAIRPSVYPMSPESVCLCTFFHETGRRVLQG